MGGVRERTPFLLTDLVLGRVTEQHQLYRYLRCYGASAAEMKWLEYHPATIDVLGSDYYLHSEMDWAWSREKGRADITPVVSNARGFASIAEDYVSRYRLPVMLSETTSLERSRSA